MTDQPDVTNSTVPEDEHDLSGHHFQDAQPGFIVCEPQPSVKTYPKADDDDGSDDVAGHVFIESKDDSGTRRDA
jgi:hypothetical protein